jgi:Protein of unknown function (DUF998)
MVSGVHRVAGALAAAVTMAAAVLLGGAVLTTEGLLYRGFVSEAGVAGQPHVTGYRWGVYAVGLALLLLAVALRPAAAIPAGLLLVSAVLASLSATVPCSPGCPLPPYETPTVADLVHGVGSTVGVGLTALAVLVLALSRRPGPVRRLSRGFLWPLVPLGATMAFALAFLGRGWTIGVAERALLVVILAWMFLAGLVTALAHYPASSPQGPADEVRTTKSG